MKFLNQQYRIHLVMTAGFVLMAPLASYFGHHWFWIVTVFNVLTINANKRWATVRVNEDGLFIGKSCQALWAETESLEWVSSSKLKVTKKSGQSYKIGLFDWPVPKRDEFKSYLTQLGF